MVLRKHHTALPALAITGALLLAGCGGGETDTDSSATGASSSSTTAQDATSTASPTSSSPAEPMEASPSGTAGSEPAESETTAPQTAAPAPDPSGADTAQPADESAAPTGPSEVQDPSATRGDDSSAAPGRPPHGGAAATVTDCRTGDLSGAITAEQGAAGSTILDLTLTNDGESACQLTGYPGVSFADADGVMIGVPAERTGAAGSGLTVLPGESATAQIKLSQAGNYGQVCNAKEAASVVVYPPESYDSLSVPYQTQICANPKIVQSEIHAFGA